MPDIPILRAGRTLLRPFSTADAPDVLNLLSDAEVTAFLPMFPLHSLAEAQSFLRNENRRLWAVCPQGTDAPAGYICVGREEPFDLGYALQRLRRYYRSLKSSAWLSQGGRRALRYRHARCKQPTQRRGDAQAGHGLLLFLPRAMATEGYFRRVSPLSNPPCRRERQNIYGILGALSRTLYRAGVVNAHHGWPCQ